MSDGELPRLPRIAPPESEGGVVVPLRPSDREALSQRARRRALRESRRTRPPRVMRWRRLLLLTIPLSILAVISMIFGMVLAIAAQLPSINHFIVTADPQNSLIYDDDGHRIAVMTDDLHRAYYVPAGEIPALMKRALIALEDKRFYDEPGVDVKGIARAFLADVTGSGATQGASTITEQLVKVIRQKEFHRTIFEKVQEAALAFQLSHKYTKGEIITAYLNDVYYGNGAWGIEAAAQTYFGNDPSSNLYGCGYTPGHPQDLCVQKLTIADAALLASLVQRPPGSWSNQEGYFRGRRNIDLLDMLNQGYITKAEYLQATGTPLPQPQYVIAPEDEVSNPGYGYFVSWVEQQILDDHKLLPNPYTAGYGIHTTLDEPLQNTAQGVIESILPPKQGLPEASLVAINNKTGGVLSMFGGYNYNTEQFNSATQAERQPGSAWKVFDLAKALEEGISPNSVWASKRLTLYVKHFSPFTVHDDEGGYVGQRTMASALTYSDNSVFAQIGVKDGLHNVAHYAHAFGITTAISANPAMTIGGVFTGVTPLDMAHAYSTIAHDGLLVSGDLASRTCAGSVALPANPNKRELYSYGLQLNWPDDSCPGPIGINSVTSSDGRLFMRDEPVYQQVPGFTSSMDQEEQSIMRTVVTEGTGTTAFIPNFWIAGKTGTTSNYEDAWFVGFTQAMPGLPDGMTVAVWVGYQKPRPMSTTYGGKPVYGGTYPAVIFKYFVQRAIAITGQEAYDRAHGESEQNLVISSETATQPIATSSLPAYGTPAQATTTTTGGGTSGTTTPQTGTQTTTPANTNTTTPLPTSTGGGAAAP